ncbi:MAG: HPr family phosphocarrier protein [Candidatus Dormibacteraeota bacterium]|nr:HPr family phosphocarrier protein [Candidatus Dormibacteraeota bacterium]
MTGASAELVVTDPHGLHLRPAAQLVKRAASLAVEVRITNLSRDPDRQAPARSLLAITGLGVDQGHRIRIEAEGEGASEAVAELRSLIEQGFGEA